MTTPAAKEETLEQVADRLAKKATQNPCSNPSCCPRTAGVVAEILSALRNEREACARAICTFCAHPESYGPVHEIEGSKRLWHSDLNNRENGVVQCLAAAIRERTE